MIVHDKIQMKLSHSKVRKTPPGKKGGQCHECDKWASYNFPGMVRKYCADCRLPGMIDVRRTMSCTGLQPHTYYIDIDLRIARTTKQKRPTQSDFQRSAIIPMRQSPYVLYFEGSPARL
jgi:hypothetical protein